MSFTLLHALYGTADIAAAMSRQERRTKMASFLSMEFETVEDDEYIAAILDVLLDTLEPSPPDRPSASELLSYTIFSLIEEDQDERNDDTPTISDSRPTSTSRTGPLIPRPGGCDRGYSEPCDNQATDSEKSGAANSLLDHETPDDHLIFPTPPSNRDSSNKPKARSALNEKVS